MHTNDSMKDSSFTEIYSNDTLNNFKNLEISPNKNSSKYRQKRPYSSLPLFQEENSQKKFKIQSNQYIIINDSHRDSFNEIMENQQSLKNNTGTPIYQVSDSEMSNSEIEKPLDIKK